MLKSFSESFLTEEYLSWLNNEEVVRFSEQRHMHHTIDSCQNYLRSFNDTPNLFLAIVVSENNMGHIGNITAYIDVNNRVADLGILIGKASVWGRGYGLEAWCVLADYLFKFGIRKITAGTMSCNTAMLKIIEKSGMIIEGTRKNYFIFEESEADLVYAALHNPALKY